MKVKLAGEPVMVLDTRLDKFCHEHLFDPLNNNFSIFTGNLAVPCIGVLNNTHALEASDLATEVTLRLNSITLQKKLRYFTKGVFLVDQKVASQIRPLDTIELELSNHDDIIPQDQQGGGGQNNAPPKELSMKMELMVLQVTPLSTYIIPVNALIKQVWMVVLTDKRYIARIVNVPHNVIPSSFSEYLKSLLEYSGLAKNTLDLLMRTLEQDELAKALKPTFDPKYVFKQSSVIDIIQFMLDAIFVTSAWDAEKASLEFYSYYCATPQQIPGLDTRNKVNSRDQYYEDFYVDNYKFLANLANGNARSFPLLGGYPATLDMIPKTASQFLAKNFYWVHIYAKTWNTVVKVKADDPKIQLPRYEMEPKGNDHVSLNIDMEMFDVPKDLADYIAYKAILRYKAHTIISYSLYINHTSGGFMVPGSSSVSAQYLLPPRNDSAISIVLPSSLQKSTDVLYEGLRIIDTIPRTTWITEKYV
jgi:hypothetical protein